MRDAIVFSGSNVLDFYDVRVNVARIPEVIGKLRRAQKIWDLTETGSFDLVSCLLAEDRIYSGNLRSKAIASAIVQLGLLERYLKLYPRPLFYLGHANGECALKVATGHVSFEEMVRGFHWHKNQPSLLTVDQPEPILSGVSLTEYRLYQREGGIEDWDYREVECDKTNIQRIITNLVEEQEVKKFVNVGPGSQYIQRYSQSMAHVDVQILDSIDMDPMLTWFWPLIKTNDGFLGSDRGGQRQWQKGIAQ